MTHDVPRFRSNALLLVYTYDLRELTYLTRFTMPSINISRIFLNLSALVLFSLVPDNLELQTLKSCFVLFFFFNMSCQTSSSKHTHFLGFRF